jgi:uncharacterized membrane protein
VVLRRAFLAASTFWVALIPLAAFAATRPAAPSSIYGFAAGVYAVGHFVCHQLPARSFHLWGAQLPVCARCTGIYVGAAVTAMVLSLSRGLSAEARSAKAEGQARLVLLLACVPTAATLAFEWSTGLTPGNWIRALAGLPLGAAVAWAIGMVN